MDLENPVVDVNKSELTGNIKLLDRQYASQGPEKASHTLDEPVLDTIVILS